MMRLAGRRIIYPVYSAVSQRCFHISNGAFHTARARAPLCLVKHPRECKKVLWDIAFNAHLHPHCVKRIPLRECALSVSADAGITRAV